MHILLIHQAFAALDEAGGTRHYEMAAYLAQHGHRVTIIASPVSYLSGAHRAQELDREAMLPGVTILRTYTYGGRHRGFVHRVLNFLSFMVSSFQGGLRVRDIDLVWGTSPPIFQAVTAWLVAVLKGVPFLFEVRDLWPKFAVAVGVLRSPFLIGIARAVEQFLYRRAGRVVVNSPGFIEHVLQGGARWVELIPNGADPGMFAPGEDGKPFRRQFGLEDKFVVMYAGAHGLSNDLPVVLEAARRLQEHRNIQFVLVGAGKEKDHLMNLAKDWALENVLFLPPIPKTQMPAALAAANACIAILKPLDAYKTTYPNKVFDYMAAGRAVILAIDGVIRRVVEEAGAGLFSPPGDAQQLAQTVLRLAADPQATRRMGAAGRSCVENNFSRARLAQKLRIVIEEMGKPSDSVHADTEEMLK